MNISCNPKQPQEDDDDKLAKRLAAYYARILFFAFLTESTVKSLEEIIVVIESTEDNQRIAKNLGLNIRILNAIQQRSNPFILQKLDYKIENANDLIRDTALQPFERVDIAMRKFGRLSESEIVTPAKIADEMVATLPFEELDKKEDVKFLDIASKQGEFSIALYRKFGKKVKSRLYAIPTSTLAYEFTRKIYTLLGMPVENIFSDFNSYDLIGKNNEKIITQLKDMNFDVIIGNPPYQVMKEDTSDQPIYHLFYDISFKLSDKVSLITPARFLFNAGKTPQKWNKKILNDSHFKVVRYESNISDVFPLVDLKGGVAIGYRNMQCVFEKIGIYTKYQQLKTLLEKVHKSNVKGFISDWVYAPESYKFSPLIHQEYSWAKGRLSKGHLYDITSNIFEKLPELFNDNSFEKSVGLIGRINNERCCKWIRRDLIAPHENLDFYKVILPKSNGTGSFGETLSTPMIGNPSIGHTQTFISIGRLKNEYEAKALLKYIQTKIVRALLGTLKVTQDNKKSVWANVPLQDFTANSDIDWSKNVEEIDAQLYAKYGLSDEEITFIESKIKPM